MIKSRTIIATPPGVTIKEQLIIRNMRQKEFALRMGMSEKHISKLINGEVQLTADMALKLEMVLGIPAHFWSNLEIIYREKLLKIQAENEMDEEIEIANLIPYNEIAKYHWVPECKRKEEKVINLRKFFEVSQLNLVKDPLIPNIACRKLGTGEKSNFAVLTWVQKVKLEARKIATRPIDITKLKEAIPVLRKMTEQNPSSFCPVLHETLKSCGIALIFLPHIKGSFLHGATFSDNSKIVIGMTARGKDSDKFWFSFFHEIGHIVLNHLSLTEGTEQKDENDADNFSKNILIPENEFKKFTDKKIFNADTITEFAKNIEINPGIVVGRLQKDGLVPYSRFNNMKAKYEISY